MCNKISAKYANVKRRMEQNNFSFSPIRERERAGQGGIAENFNLGKKNIFFTKIQCKKIKKKTISENGVKFQAQNLITSEILFIN